jgi:alpha-L-fucosidase
MRSSVLILTHLATLLHLAAAPLILPDETDTRRMQDWRSLKYGMFLHFGMSTFTGNELDPGNQPSTKYAPETIDADQWLRVAKQSGMNYAVLTSKHVAGHCLWDSKVQFRGKEFDYDVATSGNKTDVIRAFVDACGKYKIVPGLYYCLLDFRNNSVEDWRQWGANLLPEDFFQLTKDQLTELATHYPDVSYYWLDIPRAASAVQRASLYDLLRRVNPKCVVLFNHGTNNSKNGSSLTLENTSPNSWPTDILNTERFVISEPFVNPQAWQGHSYFLGYEQCDVIGKDWFWTAEDKARPVETLFRLYDETTKAGGNLLLDAGPDRSGRLVDWQIEALAKLKEKIDGNP